VTYADLLATAKEDPSKNEAQLSVARMQSTASPMPPAALNSPATPAEIATLENWIKAGYPGGSCATDGGTEGDSGPTGAAVNVFSGQPPFAPKTGPGSHNAGQNCLKCHALANGEAPEFMFAGTLYNGSGNPVVGAEIRVVDSTGTGYSVYTGPSGTFYKGGAKLAAPAHAGARDATQESLMISGVTSGGCSSCHCTGTGCTTTPVHLP
jgi:hypothetical protein